VRIDTAETSDAIRLRVSFPAQSVDLSHRVRYDVIDGCLKIMLKAIEDYAAKTKFAMNEP
jgi:hypothetical protein